MNGEATNGERSSAAIRSRLREDRLPCAAAFAIAQELGRAPSDVVAAAEALGVRVGWCQLGLFGGKEKAKPAPLPVEEIPPERRAEIETALEDGRLPCVRAWAIARRRGLERLEFGRVAEALGVRISRCQLGCF